MPPSGPLTVATSTRTVIRDIVLCSAGRVAMPIFITSIEERLKSIPITPIKLRLNRSSSKDMTPHVHGTLSTIILVNDAISKPPNENER